MRPQDPQISFEEVCQLTIRTVVSWMPASLWVSRCPTPPPGGHGLSRWMVLGQRMAASSRDLDKSILPAWGLRALQPPASLLALDLGALPQPQLP